MEQNRLYEAEKRRLVYGSLGDRQPQEADLRISRSDLTPQALREAIFSQEEPTTASLLEILSDRTNSVVISVIDEEKSLREYQLNKKRGFANVYRVPILCQYPYIGRGMDQFGGNTIIQEIERQVTWLLMRSEERNAMEWRFVLGGFDNFLLRPRDTFGEKPFESVVDLYSNHAVYYPRFDWFGTSKTLIAFLEEQGFQFLLSPRQKRVLGV